MSEDTLTRNTDRIFQYSFQLVKRSAHRGYIWRANNAWHPIPASAESKEAAERYLKSSLGEEHGYSIPDDMDLYLIDRRDILATPVAELAAA